VFTDCPTQHILPEMAMPQNYVPKPVDTSLVALPEGVAELTEQLAKNNHEVWSQTRMAQGWTYGPNRDDAKKQHPCLVPYVELPETEKKYDRDTAIGALKLIIALGYKIEKA